MLDTLTHHSSAHSGMAFSTGDLLLLRGWCEFHGIAMRIDLAGVIDGRQCEEIIILAAPGGADNWVLWRGRDGVMLERQRGSARSFASVHEAVEAALPPFGEALTEIRPTVW